ncbi:hypothetical protein B0A49_03620 [Cryomyces minteri]|uniref:Rhodopsin domain-containing protein n=1 Tax=Cryomyces minteri TaxID=331657 RepID=A0A4U0XLQ0_9PEZI|nr:hypothetical protein B0A49_03620 [Cryomyces minteri]
MSWITPEYLSQSRDYAPTVAIIFVCVFTTLVVLVRCYARIFSTKRFGLDDVLAVSSNVLYIAFVFLCVILIKEGSGRHIEYIQYVLTPDQVNLTEINDFAAHIIYTTALFVCRMSGLSFYHHLCDRHQRLLTVIKCAAVFLICAYLPQLFLLIFHCLPVTGLWPYAWQAESADFTCITWGAVYSVNSGLSLVCDVILFAIPVTMIRLLQVSLSRKIKLSFVLLPGVAVIIISIVRLYLVIVGQWADDGSWPYGPMLAIESAEIGGTLIALSVPALKPLFGSIFAKFTGTFHGSVKQSGTFNSTSRRTDGLPSSGNGRSFGSRGNIYENYGDLPAGWRGDTLQHERKTTDSSTDTRVGSGVGERVGFKKMDSNEDLLEDRELSHQGSASDFRVQVQKEFKFESNAIPLRPL